ncbi:MAG: hypothetical protein WCJ66_02530, partial [Verrucomicrobiota bacterium]
VGAGWSQSAGVWTLVDGTKTWTFSVATGILSLVDTGSGSTAYDNWAAAKGLSALNKGPDQDPDQDGSTNLAEFAFNGNPLNGSDHGQVHILTTDNDISRKLILTIAVLAGTPVFSSDDSPTATFAGITYTIQGGTDLSTPAKVNGLASPVTSGLPGAGNGYEYRSFSLASSVGLTGKGFLRAKVTQ